MGWGALPRIHEGTNDVSFPTLLLIVHQVVPGVEKLHLEGINKVADIKLFQLTAGSVVELEGKAVALEKSLQDIFERNLNDLLGVRFLSSELKTSNSGRMDTLGVISQHVVHSIHL